jgi:hypothetical protein
MGRGKISYNNVVKVIVVQLCSYIVVKVIVVQLCSYTTLSGIESEMFSLRVRVETII